MAVELTLTAAHGLAAFMERVDVLITRFTGQAIDLSETNSLSVLEQFGFNSGVMIGIAVLAFTVAGIAVPFKMLKSSGKGDLSQTSRIGLSFIMAAVVFVFLFIAVPVISGFLSTSGSAVLR